MLQERLSFPGSELFPNRATHVKRIEKIQSRLHIGETANPKKFVRFAFDRKLPERVTAQLNLRINKMIFKILDNLSRSPGFIK